MKIISLEEQNFRLKQALDRTEADKGQLQGRIDQLVTELEQSGSRGPSNMELKL